MNEFTTILAFGLLGPELGRDILRNLQAPGLAALLGHARIQSKFSSPAFARALPHETLLAQALYGEPALPAYAWLDQETDSGHWFVLNPVHIHIARDHLILTDQRQLPLPEEQSRALFEACQPLFTEQGMTLRYCHANTWLLRADAWADMQCASLDAACGHNIDIWLPKAASAQDKQWRKLHNEVQMLWHQHAVNDMRAEQGWPAVNALWLTAASALPVARQPPALSLLSLPNTLSQAACQPSSLHLLAREIDRPLHSALAPAKASESASLLYLDQLSQAALSNDWGIWLECMHELEKICFAPLWEQLRQGHIRQLRLIISDSQQAKILLLRPWHTRLFWRKPSLQSLISQPHQQTGPKKIVPAS